MYEFDSSTNATFDTGIPSTRINIFCPRSYAKKREACRERVYPAIADHTPVSSERNCHLNQKIQIQHTVSLTSACLTPLLDQNTTPNST